MEHERSRRGAEHGGELAVRVEPPREVVQEGQHVRGREDERRGAAEEGRGERGEREEGRDEFGAAERLVRGLWEEGGFLQSETGVGDEQVAQLVEHGGGARPVGRGEAAFGEVV